MSRRRHGPGRWIQRRRTAGCRRHRPLSTPPRRFGIRFRHDNGASGRFLYPELFGGGVAVLDLDGDRWPDLLFVNDAAPAPLRHGLYRNNRDGTFTDVSAGSGLDTADIYALGAAVADYDNDGRDDVFITTVDGGRLFHNAGNGRFADVTRAPAFATPILRSAPRGSITTATASRTCSSATTSNGHPAARSPAPAAGFAATADQTPTGRARRSSIATAAAAVSRT